MWDDLKKWLESFDIQFPIVNDKMKEIEKEYGVG
jgi:alkyl hydroperoxide reductase subunit AhpC